MPANPEGNEQESGLPPPGTRSGAGAQTLLPYLAKSMQAKPAASAEGTDKTPPETDPVVPHGPARAP
jgi:hypothetical protein